MSEKKRYILETNDNCQRIALIGACDGLVVMMDKAVDKLQDADKELGEAYHKGFEAGQLEATTLEYQQGLNDAWECAKRIALIKTDEDCPYFTVAELKKIFGYSTLQSVFDTYSASEAIEKIQAYEQQKATPEIKVGDEVTPINALNRPFIVVSVKDNVIHGFDLNGGCTSRGYFLHETHLKKTGRHFTQVAELLKAMNGEQRNCSACKHDGDPRFCDPCRHNDMWQPKGGE